MKGLCRLRDLRGQRSRKVHGPLGDFEELSVARMKGHGKMEMDKWGDRRKATDAKVSGS